MIRNILAKVFLNKYQIICLAILVAFGLSPVSALAVEIGVGANANYIISNNDKIYVPSLGDNSVYIIDPETDAVIDTILVGVDSGISTLVGDKMYMRQSGSVAVIDTVTDTLSSTIPVGTGVGYLTVVGNKVYAMNNGSDNISVINSETDTVVSTINVGDSPVFGSIVGEKLYVSNLESDNVSVIDTATDTVSATIAVGDGANYSRALGSKLYVGNTNTNTVSVINTVTNTVIGTITVGTNPYYLNSYAGKIYVTTSPSDLYVIDSLTDTVVSDITVGDNPFYITVAGKLLFVNNVDSSNLSVVDPSSGAVVDTVATDVGPLYSIPYENKVYVVNAGDSVGSVTVVDTTNLPSRRPYLSSFSTSVGNGRYYNGQEISISANFGMPILAGSAMSIELNNGSLVTLDEVSGSALSGTFFVTGRTDTPDLGVSSIESASVTDSTGTYTRTSYDLPSSVGDFEGENSFIARNLGDTKNIEIGDYVDIGVGDNPYQISAPVSIVGEQYIYVANQGSDNVSVVRVSDQLIVESIDIGDEPYGLATVTIGGTTYVYVANINSDDVSVIDTSTNTVIDTVDVGVKPYYVAVVGSDVYVTNGASNTVSVIDANTNTVTDTITVGLYPRGIKAHGTDLYVANYGDPNYSGGDYISVIDSLTNTVSDTIILPIGSSGPRGVTVLGDEVYVANYRSDNVSVINTNTNTVTDTIDVGIGPRGIVGYNDKVYVENFDAGTISVIDTEIDEVTIELPVGHSPAGMSLVGSDLFYSSFQDGLVRIFDTTTNSLLLELDVDVDGSSASGSRVKKKSSTIDIPIADSSLIYAASSTPGSQKDCYRFSTLMRLGSRGLEITKLQQLLNSQSFDTGIVDGIFGPITDDGIKAFQKSKNLDADGIVGPITRGALNSVCDI